MNIKTIILIIIASTLPACNVSEEQLSVNALSSSPPQMINASGDTLQKISLSKEQVHMIQEAVKKVISYPNIAQFEEITAVSFAQKPGIHICGSVAYTIGSKNESLPFYVELRKDGTNDIIHRGQVGTDKSKSSKVNFVCRYHRNV